MRSIIREYRAESCTWLKLLVVVHWCLWCAWSVFGSVILNQWCVRVCVCVCVRYYRLRTTRTVHTHAHTHTHTNTPLVQKLRCQTPTKHTTNISEPLPIISVKYSFILPDDGSHTIRNMSEWFLILSLLNFYAT